MLKNIKHRFHKRAIIKMVVIIIIIFTTCYAGIISFPFFATFISSSEPSIISMEISILSFGISIISLAGMIIIFDIQTKISDNQSIILNSISEHLSFESIRFPDSIEKVIILIQQYKNEKRKRYYLHIYTDVPGYAIFSNNKLWNEFYQALIDAKKNFCIDWHFYSERKLNEHINKQFKSWYSFDKNQIKTRIEESISNIYIRHPLCTYKSTCKSTIPTDCKIIRTIKAECSSSEPVKNDVDTIKNRVKELHKFAIAKINELNAEGGDVKITRISNDLPFFAWIFLEKNHNSLAPIAGIVSYSFYNANGEEREKGFMTKDKKLLEILYEIINNQKKK